MNNTLFRSLITFAALSALAACGLESADNSPARQTMYGNFKAIASRSGLSLAEHPSYAEPYVSDRAQLYCGLMSQGNITKLTTEISFPPVRWTESPRDRPRLEAAILMAGTPAACPANQRIADQWLRTYMR